MGQITCNLNLRKKPNRFDQGAEKLRQCVVYLVETRQDYWCIATSEVKELSTIMGDVDILVKIGGLQNL